MARILVATADGLHAFDPAGHGGPVELPGRAITAVAHDQDALWAIGDGREVLRRPQAGEWSVSGTVPDDVRANCLAGTDAGILAGTSSAGLYRVMGNALHRVESFDGVAGRNDWYTPWGGPPDTRSISEDGDAVYVNVHVGGIVRSTDRGASWGPTIDIDADVHRVWATDGLLLAACARGLAVSQDRGQSWGYRTDGLHASYCRGVTVCGDVVLVSASTGPRGGRAALYRGDSTAGPLERCRGGLPEWFDQNIDSLCLDALPDGAVAAFGTGDGRVFASSDQGTAWEELASDLPGVHGLLVMP